MLLTQRECAEGHSPFWAWKTKLEQRLADAHISARWFPEGEYEHFNQILELLLV